MKKIRTSEQIVADGLAVSKPSWTELTTDLPDFHEKVRPAAIWVLERLPDEDYVALLALNVWFFAPRKEVTGWCARLPTGKSKIIYLSPVLYEEKYDRTACQLIVAHEIAHAICDHFDHSSTPIIEDEAWHKVIAMGFGTDAEIVRVRALQGGW